MPAPYYINNVGTIRARYGEAGIGRLSGNIMPTCSLRLDGKQSISGSRLGDSSQDTWSFKQRECCTWPAQDLLSLMVVITRRVSNSSWNIATWLMKALALTKLR
jgi:hypothetical protein